MSDERDEFHGVGGSYIVEGGVKRRVADAPKEHPDGNRPRDSDGKPLDARAEEREPARASMKPAGGKRERGPQADIER